MKRNRRQIRRMERNGRESGVGKETDLYIIESVDLFREEGIEGSQNRIEKSARKETKICTVVKKL